MDEIESYLDQFRFSSMRKREPSCNKGHLFTNENTIYRPRKDRPGQFWRECRQCKFERNRVAVENGSNREAGIRFRYGITEENFNTLWEKQLGLCAICHNGLNKYIAYNNKGDRKAAHIDHDHITNKIRGLLCGSCNIGIGNLQDSIDLLNRAIEYLAKHKMEI